MSAVRWDAQHRPLLVYYPRTAPTSNCWFCSRDEIFRALPSNSNETDFFSAGTRLWPETAVRLDDPQVSSTKYKMLWIILFKQVSSIIHIVCRYFDSQLKDLGTYIKIYPFYMYITAHSGGIRSLDPEAPVSASRDDTTGPCRQDTSTYFILSQMTSSKELKG
jgi:hypothetical protein